MADVLETIHLLPTTAETEEGPLIEHRPGEVVVRYDFEGEEAVEWAVVRFSTVVAVCFTPDIAATSMMIDAYSRVCALHGSPWLSALRSRAAEDGQSVSEATRHFLIFFDHYGCLEVLADAVEVVGNDD